ncbi:site-specific DNA-methyltransferase [Acidaminococcus fermentans]|jgi:adenine-specific DNA-methyltransferase|uniref:site-specific DNA-methyltransferase n=1 Tax=Acidaminococcus fermentans TaxID=905 RepID=UPI003E3623A8
MANINETIANVEKLDPELARQLRKYVRDHAYGLVFEHNLPEAVRLYTKRAVVGDTVNIRPARGEEEKTENKVAWNVKETNGNQATIENGQESKIVSLEDLVPIVSYRDVIYPGLKEVDRIERGSKDDPYQVVINAENYHALEMLTYCYAGKVDCIYIDPPYNTGAKDWKYNNDYVDANDKYRHSKWLAFIERRLKLAKQLLNPKSSVLIVTIDEKEYTRLGLLLEQMFPEANIQMISSVINRKGSARDKEFSRVDEYLYFVMLGTMGPAVTENNMLDVVPATNDKGTDWLPMRRAGTNSLRKDRPNLFYPIYFNTKTNHIVKVGESLPLTEKLPQEDKQNDVIAIWPIKKDGTEGRWQLQNTTVRQKIKEGTVRVNRQKNGSLSVQYLNEGAIKEIESGELVVKGHDEQGALIVKRISSKLSAPKTIWNQRSHDATAYGTSLLTKIIGNNRFSFPKSLYAVHDALRFFIADKPDALVVDFFAGSGTTIHAVNLMNSEDNGHRCCVCITNNEVSDDEQKLFIKKGIRPGDDEWEAHGIAKYVTWPRTKSSIEGVDVNGNPLKGTYIGSDTPMSDGFAANAIFFELTYESAWPIRLDNAFDAIAPILWMQAGCKGPIIHRIGKSYLTTDYYGVLFDYGQASKFCEKVKRTPSIKTVYVVTDDQRRYSNICRRLPGVEVHRLYETFLKTFEICGEGGLD